MARPRLQRVWERLLALALRGMNVGGGSFPETSGERAIIKALPRSSLVFDVGANRGQYAKMALSERPDLTLYCFEPSPAAFADLEKLPIRSFPFGFGEQDETVPLYADDKGSIIASVYPSGLPEVEMVQLRKLETFCVENGIAHIDLLKLDVEGHELPVLRGMGEVRPDRIQFEFGKSHICARSFLRDFFETLSGYKLYRVLPNGLFEVAYSPRMEQFGTTNYLAVRQ